MAALLALGMTLVASTPARAKKPAGESWSPIKLTNVGDEPQASGEATLTDVVLVDIHFNESGSVCWECYTAGLRMDCKNLTPGATYSTPAGTLTAGSRGKVTVAGNVYFEIGYSPNWDGWPPVWKPWPYVVDVVRLNPGGAPSRPIAPSGS